MPAGDPHRGAIDREQLIETRARLSSLFRHPQVEKKEMSLRVGAVVLDVLDMALKANGWLAPVNRFSVARHYSIAKRVERLLESQHGAEVNLKQIAEQTVTSMIISTGCCGTMWSHARQLRARVRLRGQ